LPSSSTLSGIMARLPVVNESFPDPVPFVEEQHSGRLILLGKSECHHDDLVPDGSVMGCRTIEGAYALVPGKRIGLPSLPVCLIDDQDSLVGQDASSIEN